MPLDAKHYAHSEGDGRFGTTSVDDLGRALAAMDAAGRGVIHLHGGLVSCTRGLEKAERLVPAYQRSGAHPLCAIWESGFLETIVNNLPQVKDEKVFRVILRKLLKWVAGKLSNAAGTKSAQLRFPNDLEVKKLEKRLASGEEPLDALDIPANLEPLSQEQEDAFLLDLTADPDFEGAVQAIVLTHSKSIDPSNTARSAAARSGDGQTLLDDALIEELRDENQDGHKAVFSGLTLARHALRVLARVVRRYITKRHHGVYATVVEELLREAYLDKVGGAVWASMKQDTADTFDPAASEPRVGTSLVLELGRLYAAGKKPPVSVVAHSAGSIYACHLLAAIKAARDDAGHPLPADFRLANLVFLAPAVRFDLFARTLALGDDLFGSFRMFALSDALESGYWEVPVVYPRSLLYFVSGVVERDRDGESYSDCPIVGMQRYYDAARYPEPELGPVRDFMAGPGRVIWSKAPETTAEKHGELDSDEPTLNSINAMIG